MKNLIFWVTIIRLGYCWCLPDSVRLEKFFSTYWLLTDAWRNSLKSAAVGGGEIGEHWEALDIGLKLIFVLDVGVSISLSRWCLWKKNQFKFKVKQIWSGVNFWMLGKALWCFIYILPVWFVVKFCTDIRVGFEATRRCCRWWIINYFYYWSVR